MSEPSNLKLELEAEITALSNAILKAYANGGVIKYNIAGRGAETIPVTELEKLRDAKRLKLAKLNGKGTRNVGIRFI